jgi:hypothetical protein
LEKYVKIFSFFSGGISLLLRVMSFGMPKFKCNPETSDP